MLLVLGGDRFLLQEFFTEQVGQNDGCDNGQENDGIFGVFFHDDAVFWSLYIFFLLRSRRAQVLVSLSI